MSNDQDKTESALTRESNKQSGRRDSITSRDESATKSSRSATGKGQAERKPSNPYEAQGKKSEANMDSDEDYGRDGKAHAAKSQSRTPASQRRDRDQGRRFDE